MTEYDFSPEAYDHFLRTQSRVANWVLHTEHHRPTFEAAAPGAPGLPPAPRSPSPPVLLPLPRLSHAHAKPPIYQRVPPSPSSSEASYVHVVSPQIRRYRPPPPPIYAPPVAPRSPFPVQPYPSPVGARVSGDHSSLHPSGRQHRSKSHSYSHRQPPIYASPPASPYISPQPVIYMSSKGHPAPPYVWPTKPPREHYPEPSSLRTHMPSHYDQPLTPPTSSSTSTSFGNAPVANSRQRNLHTDFHSPPLPDDSRQHHRQHSSTNTLPGLEPPYISRHIQRAYHSHHCDCHDCTRRHHPYSDHSRRNLKSTSQLNHQTVPPQLPIYRDYSHGRQLNSVYSIPSVPIGTSVPPRYPIDDRSLV